MRSPNQDRAAFTAGWVASKAWSGIAPTKEGEQTRIDFDYKTWRKAATKGLAPIKEKCLCGLDLQIIKRCGICDNDE